MNIMILKGMNGEQQATINKLNKRNEVEKFMEETLDESELDIVDIIHKNNKVEIIAEKISEL